VLNNGSIGRAAVPSGASTGIYEALEKRDNDMQRYAGKGVLQAVALINENLAQKLRGVAVTDQKYFDDLLLSWDDSVNKAKIGANTILALSLAAAKAAAAANKLPLYRYLWQGTNFILPVPMINIINGGAHANNNLAIQEFLILPVGAPSFAESLRYGAAVFHELKNILQRHNLSISVGDEGGFTPNLPKTEAALDYIMLAIDAAGYVPGKDIYLGLDVASSELYHDGYYHLENQHFSSAEMLDYLGTLISKYPLLSIEDGMAEQDWLGWRNLSNALGDKVQLVGDDLFVTQELLLRRGIAEGVANAILIKANQVGSLSETLATIALAQQAKYNVIISHRSGETEDTTIADLAIATVASQIKAGSLCRTERVAKYNQLLRIAEELGSVAQYAGTMDFFNRFTQFKR
jgi:enolase